MVASFSIQEEEDIVEGLLKPKLCVFRISIFCFILQYYWYICECQNPHFQNTKGQTFAIKLQIFVWGKLCADIMWVQETKDSRDLQPGRCMFCHQRVHISFAATRTDIRVEGLQVLAYSGLHYKALTST